MAGNFFQTPSFGGARVTNPTAGVQRALENLSNIITQNAILSGRAQAFRAANTSSKDFEDKIRKAIQDKVTEKATNDLLLKSYQKAAADLGYEDLKNKDLSYYMSLQNNGKPQPKTTNELLNPEEVLSGGIPKYKTVEPDPEKIKQWEEQWGDNGKYSMLHSKAGEYFQQLLAQEGAGTANTPINLKDTYQDGYIQPGIVPNKTGNKIHLADLVNKGADKFYGSLKVPINNEYQLLKYKEKLGITDDEILQSIAKDLGITSPSGYFTLKQRYSRVLDQLANKANAYQKNIQTQLQAAEKDINNIAIKVADTDIAAAKAGTPSSSSGGAYRGSIKTPLTLSAATKLVNSDDYKDEWSNLRDNADFDKIVSNLVEGSKGRITKDQLVYVLDRADRAYDSASGNDKLNAAVKATIAALGEMGYKAKVDPNSNSIKFFNLDNTSSKADVIKAYNKKRGLLTTILANDKKKIEELKAALNTKDLDKTIDSLSTNLWNKYKMVLGKRVYDNRGEYGPDSEFKENNPNTWSAEEDNEPDYTKQTVQNIKNKIADRKALIKANKKMFKELAKPITKTVKPSEGEIAISANDTYQGYKDTIKKLQAKLIELNKEKSNAATDEKGLIQAELEATAGKINAISKILAKAEKAKQTEVEKAQEPIMSTYQEAMKAINYEIDMAKRTNSKKRLNDLLKQRKNLITYYGTTLKDIADTKGKVKPNTELSLVKNNKNNTWYESKMTQMKQLIDKEKNPRVKKALTKLYRNLNKVRISAKKEANKTDKKIYKEIIVNNKKKTVLDKVIRAPLSTWYAAYNKALPKALKDNNTIKAIKVEEYKNKHQIQDMIKEDQKEYKQLADKLAKNKIKEYDKQIKDLRLKLMNTSVTKRTEGINKLKKLVDKRNRWAKKYGIPLYEEKAFLNKTRDKYEKARLKKLNEDNKKEFNTLATTDRNKRKLNKMDKKIKDLQEKMMRTSVKERGSLQTKLDILVAERNVFAKQAGFPLLEKGAFIKPIKGNKNRKPIKLKKVQSLLPLLKKAK